MGFDQEINRFDAEEMERQQKRERDQRYRQDQSQREKLLLRKDALFSFLRLLVAGAALFMVILAVDGIRREGDNLRATLSRITGDVDIRPHNLDGVIAAHEGQQLVGADKLETKSKGAAVLLFPEGTALRLDNNTRFEVRQLDFYRPNTRNRSFLLENGGVLCRMSSRYGTAGQLIISTNNAVVAGRRGGFYVHGGGNSVQVDVIDGLVVLKNCSGRLELRSGMRGVVSGSGVPTIGSLPINTKREQATELVHLRSFESATILDALVPMERQWMGFLNPMLQKIGLVSGGWSIADNDDARRLATATELKNLRKTLEGAGGAPEVLSLGTLSELSMDQGERDRALLSFAGAMLDSYEKRGTNGYEIRVRARDSSQTPYILTERGVQQGK